MTVKPQALQLTRLTFGLACLTLAAAVVFSSCGDASAQAAATGDDQGTVARAGLPSQQYCTAGGVCRPRDQKAAETISVCDYELPCPSLTDDTPAVSLAYAAVAATGKCIFFPAGKYKFNLTIDRNSVCIRGEGRTRVASGGTSTIFTPTDLTKPIIQVGDGTSLVMYTTLSHFSMLGDGTFTVAGTSTSDGIKILGAYNTTVDDFSIGQMGGHNIWVTSSATRASSYNYFTHGEVTNPSRYGVLVDNGLDFTSATVFDEFNFSSGQIAGGGDVLLRIEGVNVYVSNSWIQVLDGHGNISLAKNAAGNAPGLSITNVAIDTGGNQAFTAINIDLLGQTHRPLGWYIKGTSYFIDGKIHYDDGYVIAGDGATNTVPPPNRFGNDAKMQMRLFFDVFADNTGTVFYDANVSPMYLQGRERTQGGGSYILEEVGAALRIPGTWPQPLQVGAASAIWKNATTNRLHYDQLGAFPGNDIDGLQLTPLRKALTYTASMTPVFDQGSWFYIAATNGTAFTINAPQMNMFTPASYTGVRLTFTIAATTVTALSATNPFAAIYKMATWTQPGAVGTAAPCTATGCQRSIDFLWDGTSWVEVSRTPADVPN